MKKSLASLRPIKSATKEQVVALQAIKTGWELIP
jgi:hypothetical protein